MHTFLLSVACNDEWKDMEMAWVYLIVAGLLEVGWALGLKYSEGFSKLAPSIVTIVLMIASFTLLSQAVKTLPLGTAYAIWTGIGAVGTAIAGMVLLGEPRDVTRLVCIGLIVAGIIGIKFFSPAS
jgi:quaternary ammonium compound-resistance protein SugE